MKYYLYSLDCTGIYFIVRAKCYNDANRIAWSLFNEDICIHGFRCIPADIALMYVRDLGCKIY